MAKFVDDREGIGEGAVVRSAQLRGNPAPPHNASMPRARDFVSGPWRAVSVLGVTQILAWGALFYPPVLTVPLIAAERGWSMTFAMGGFSAALLVGGLVSPRVGALIDRFGGHAVMPWGSLAGALGLVLLAEAGSRTGYIAAWMLTGVAMAASLYDPAFASLGRIFGTAARLPITLLTLVGGFASTVSWPVTHALIGAHGWRGAYLFYAVLLALVAAPLHAYALPRSRAPERPAVKTAARGTERFPPARGAPFLLVAAAFASYAFVPSGLAAHLLAILERLGIGAASAVAIGALFGPAQVAARVLELAFGRNLEPLWLARLSVALLIAAFALLAVSGVSISSAAVFVVLFGAANGLLTIARGAVPLALFGPVGYGSTIGRIAGPYLLMQSFAPLALAFVVEQVSDIAALAVTCVFALAALGCFAAVRRCRV